MENDNDIKHIIYLISSNAILDSNFYRLFMFNDEIKLSLRKGITENDVIFCLKTIKNILSFLISLISQKEIDNYKKFIKDYKLTLSLIFDEKEDYFDKMNSKYTPIFFRDKHGDCIFKYTDLISNLTEIVTNYRYLFDEITFRCIKTFYFYKTQIKNNDSYFLLNWFDSSF